LSTPSRRNRTVGHFRSTLNGVSAPDNGSVPVRGVFEERFAPLAEELGVVAASDAVAGASLCVYEHGLPVVDIAAGWVDAPHTRLRPPDDVQVMFSATKGVVGAVIADLAADGVLDVDQPVSRAWPEFGVEGKERLTIGDVLAHRAGLPAVNRQLRQEEALDPDLVADELARQRPVWPPGRAHGYHAFTFGPLAARIVQRVTGAALSDLLLERIVGPLGLDLSIGLPVEDHFGRRLVDLIPAPPAPPVVAATYAALRTTKALPWRVFTVDGTFISPDGYAGFANSPTIRRALLPAASGIGDARSLARLYAALMGEVDGVRLSDHQTMREMTRPRSTGMDLCLWRPSTFGVAFSRRSLSSPLPTAAAFGHHGVGGVVAYGDPATGLAVAYLPTRIPPDSAPDPAWRRLARVLAEITGAAPDSIRDQVIHASRSTWHWRPSPSISMSIRSPARK